ncbi:MAG: 6-phosphogluconolactonase [Terracoccus sp.]
MTAGPGPDPEVSVADDKTSLAADIAERLVGAAEAALAERGRCHLVMTGGSMGSALIAALAERDDRARVDWAQVDIWWGDERYLPAGDPDRNDTQNDEAGLSGLGLDQARVHRIAGPDTSGSAEESADTYSAEVRGDGSGAFDVVILGVGPDGHVASLFPHHPAQRTTDAIAIAVHDSPKPPPDRVSLTFECLERSREVWFVVAGSDKAEAVAAALTPGADRWDVPASGPRGSDATRWLLDADAAARLPERD